MGNISASEEHHADIESESIRPTFVVKAGGPQTVGAGGMVRSSGEGKVDYILALDGVMFRRWAEHLDRATKPRGDFPGYAKRNWMQATKGTPAERLEVMERARISAFRHFLQWLNGDVDEDHAAAVFFNLNVYETVKGSI
jgi:hypothetical protein